MKKVVYTILITVNGKFIEGWVAAKYSKRMFLNTHKYSNLGYRSSLL